MRRNLALPFDEAAPADMRERLRQAVAAEPWVAEVAVGVHRGGNHPRRAGALIG